MARPLIAVNGLYHAEDPMLRLRQRYADAVRAAGGTPVALVPDLDETTSPEEIRATLSRVDGLMLTGGDDFHTEPLGLGPTHPSADPTPIEKQRYDLELARAALEMDLPVLGICYGMQCLALADGATLWQDVPTQFRPSDGPAAIQHANSALHPVQSHAGTKLASATGLAPFTVVSRHHQAVRTVPPPWIVSALDDEGLVEAIERPDRRFAVGVQWHPELSPDLVPDDPSSPAIVRAFVDACAAGPGGATPPA